MRSTSRWTSRSILGIAMLVGVALSVALVELGSPTPASAQSPISVAVSPSAYGVTVSQSVSLNATVVNDSTGRGVTWSVSGSSCSGSGCGTLSSVTSTSVIYTAPATGGFYLVTATSVADVTRSATASIGVTDLAGVFTYRNDGTRTSVNAKEYLLTPSNVNASSFGKLFSCTVDGSVYAQPLWVANLAIGGGTHNVVIVATQNDSVYAFDADNGSGTTCTQYWKASLLTSAYGAGAGATPVPPSDTGETQDIPTPIGITSTPVIDPSTNSLFVVSKTKESGSYFQRLHKLSLADGSEKAGAPVALAASVTGSGNGSSGNRLPYDALHQNQRSGLALVNGVVYIASGSHGDISPWHGWILAYNASTLSLAGAFCTTPNSNGAGIWMSGSAPVFDASNNLFVISSNGSYDGTTEFGDSFLKLSTSTGLSLIDWFTPDNQANLASNNIDLGMGGAVTLLDSVSGPFPHLVIGGGKGGVLFLINRDNMGHFNATGNNSQAVQTWSLGNIIASSGTFWQNTFYIGAANTPLQAFAFNTTTGLFNTNPTSQSGVSVAFPGLTPAISASGTSNAILWTVDSSKSGTNGAATGPAVLYAFDPNNLGNELWDSTQATGNRDQAGNAVKFVVPTVANGKVYVGAVQTLTVYGLLSTASAAAQPTFSPAPGAYASPQNVTLSDTTSGATIYYTTNGSTPTTSSNVYAAPINVSTTTTIKAIAAAPGLNNSPVSVGDYTIQVPVTGTISFIQGSAATPQSPQTTVPVTFSGAQTAGDLNVVVVGWNDITRSVSSVTDTKGNTYTLAVGPTANSAGLLSQLIYYAKNIAAAPAGGNTVTVTFNGAAAFPDVRILEYSGVDPVTPVDVTSASTGSSTSSASAAVTTANANDLLFAANTVQTATTSAGTGFISRMITVPDGDIAEDRSVAATGSYSATANLNPAGQWIMQMVAFRAAGSSGSGPTAPSNLLATAVSATQINLSWTASTGGVTGYLLERCQDVSHTDCTQFSQIATLTATTYNDTGLNPSTAYNYRVRATGGAGNFSGYSNIANATTPATVPPTVSSVSPSSGSTAGGTLVTITGTNFVAGATVTFGSGAATNVVVVSGTTITATTPAGSAGAVTVTVTVSGQSGSLASGFTYVVAPTVSSVSPNSGPVAGGTSVTISGTNFAAGATVTFGSGSATNVVVVNSTTITATTPAGTAGAVTVAVTVSGQSGNLANGFTYIGVPTVSSVSPNTGSTAGGTPVTITGTNFASGATVTFGGGSATGVTVVNSTTITATTPAGSAGAVTVTVTNVGSQSGSLANGFTYVVVPTVSSVSPNSGPVAGGTSVTISGTNFAAGATVKFGSASATNVVVVNATTITATTPAVGSAGAVTVTVTVNSQSGSLANGFTYTGSIAIAFGQVAAATPQTPTASVPVTYPAAQTAGDLNIVVVGWNDTTSTVQSVKDSAGNNYARAVGPTAGTGLQQSIYYAANIVGGSNTVTVTFSAAAAFPDVRILEYRGVTTLDVTAGASGNSATASSGAATTTNANELIFGANTVATGNAAAGSGFTARIITTPDGDIAEDKIVTVAGSNSATATLTGSGPWVMQMATFTGAPTPTVSSVSPNTGSTAGGTSVTITGTNFAAGATVTFGSGTATGVTVVNNTTITATTPAGSAGAVTVTVTNPTAQSGSLANGFTYVAPPTVTSVSPTNGGLGGGTSVTITGANFASGATVTFGSAAATNVVVVNATTITATTPAGSAGAVAVTVTNSNGLSGGLASAFTYVPPPTVSSVSPNNGATAGGTAVTITGTNFLAGATVTFGSGSATGVTVVNSTTMTATTPVGSAGAVTVTVTVGAQSGSLASGYTYVNQSVVVTPPGSFAGSLTGTAAPTYVAGQQYYNATSGTSFTSAPFNSTGADLLVVLLGCHNATVFTITDSFGNTWLPLAGPAYKVGNPGFPMEGELFYAPNAKTGTGHAITVTLSQTEPLVMSISAFTGDNIYSPIDAYSSITGDNGTLAKYIVSSPLATSQPNDLVLGIVKGYANNSYTAGTGYTSQAASTGNNFSAETQAAPSVGSYNSSFIAANGDYWQTVTTAISPKPTQTALSWTASSGGIIANYFIERCAGLACSNFSQIASVPSSTLTYTDTTISSGTVYNYRVRAQNTVGTFSDYSNVSAFSPIIPQVVSNFAATPTGRLTWNASTESGGSISLYSVERCAGLGCSNFSQLATTSGTSYTDTSIVAGTTYNYRVRAQDANGFWGPYSVVATATIPAFFDNAVDGGNNGGSSNSLTYSFTVGSNPNRLLLVSVVGDPSVDDISSVKYAGATMTLVGKVQTPTDRWHYLYYLLAPASGANNVVITAASSHMLMSEASSWYNVAQSGQPGSFSTNTSPSNVFPPALTTSLPASSNNAIVAETMWAPLQILPSHGSSQLVADAAMQSLGMFSSIPSPVTQAFPVSMTNTWGGQFSASSIMASFSLASNGAAGITYDNSKDGGNNGGTTSSLTYSFTVGAGANRLLVVNLIGDTSADDISSVTYGGTSMTLIGKVRAASNNWQYLYYLLNPASGAHNVAVTAASSHYLISEAASWYNVKQSAQPDAFTTNTAPVGVTSTTTSLTTVASGALVVQGIWSVGHLAAGIGATPILTDAAFGGAGIFASGQSPVSPAGNVSMTTICDGSNSTGVVMASFAPAP